MENKKGFSLIEAMIAVSIMFAVIVSILGAFATQIRSDNQTADRNMAIALAESRMEEFIKMPASQINVMVSPVTDYFVQDLNHRFVPYGVPGDIPPLNAKRFMQRQVSWTWNGIILDLNVQVNYMKPTIAGGNVKCLLMVDINATRGEA